jgi:hypothetical protein
VGIHSIKRVQIATLTESPWNWATYHHWKEMDGTLRLSEFHLPPPGMAMRLYFEGPHAEMEADLDPVTDAVHPDRIAWLATMYAVQARMTRPETSSTEAREPFGLAQQMADRTARHPIQRVPRDARWVDLP